MQPLAMVTLGPQGQSTRERSTVMFDFFWGQELPGPFRDDFRGIVTEGLGK